MKTKSWAKLSRKKECIECNVLEIYSLKPRERIIFFENKRRLNYIFFRIFSIMYGKEMNQNWVFYFVTCGKNNIKY